MHFYKKNIKDFNNSTRHFSRIERSIYQDLIELYYDKEQPLKNDLDWINRHVLARTNEEKEAVTFVLTEKFKLIDGEYNHDRCNETLADYFEAVEDEEEKKKNEKERQRRYREKRKVLFALARECELSISYNLPNSEIEKLLSRVTDGEHTSDTMANHKPITNNQKPITKLKPTAKSKKLSFSDDDLKCANYILDKIRKLNPEHEVRNIEAWANEIRLMVEQDNRSHKQICELYKWISEDEFERTVVLSVKKLRKRWSDLVLKSKTPATKAQKPDWAKIPFPYDGSTIDAWVRKHKHPEAPRGCKSYQEYVEKTLKPHIEQRLAKGE